MVADYYLPWVPGEGEQTRVRSAFRVDQGLRKRSDDLENNYICEVPY